MARQASIAGFVTHNGEHTIRVLVVCPDDHPVAEDVLRAYANALRVSPVVPAQATFVTAGDLFAGLVAAHASTGTRRTCEVYSPFDRETTRRRTGLFFRHHWNKPALVETLQARTLRWRYGTGDRAAYEAAVAAHCSIAVFLTTNARGTRPFSARPDDAPATHGAFAKMSDAKPARPVHVVRVALEARPLEAAFQTASAGSVVVPVPIGVRYVPRPA